MSNKYNKSDFDPDHIQKQASWRQRFDTATMGIIAFFTISIFLLIVILFLNTNNAVNSLPSKQGRLWLSYSPWVINIVLLVLPVLLKMTNFVSGYLRIIGFLLAIPFILGALIFGSCFTFAAKFGGMQDMSRGEAGGLFSFVIGLLSIPLTLWLVWKGSFWAIRLLFSTQNTQQGKHKNKGT